MFTNETFWNTLIDDIRRTGFVRIVLLCALVRRGTQLRRRWWLRHCSWGTQFAKYFTFDFLLSCQ